MFPSTTVAENSSSTLTIANSSKNNNKSQMKKGTARYKTKSRSATTVA